MNRKFSQGFTLIELLIVMAIIAVLAVGVLIGLDPIEQIRKAQDGTKVNIISQYSGAQERYYAANQEYSWDTDSGVTAVEHIYNLDADGAGICTDAGCTVQDSLLLKGELKSGIMSQVNSEAANTIIHFDKPGGTTATLGYSACFSPESKAYEWSAGALTKEGMYYATANAGTGALVATCASVTNCYLCIVNGETI
jgi:prepilin-type N-terminal cleavage/methylation domain-containing protein